MRRILVGLAVLALAGCVAPPTDGDNPYACGEEPVDLGPAGRVEAMSADGQVLVVRASTPVEGGMRYDLVDRRRGQRHEIVTTSPSGDGAAIFMDAAGSRIYGLRYPALAEGESVWFLHDVASRATFDIAPILPGFAAPFAFADDLATAMVPSSGGTWELLDVSTGVRTPLGLVADPAWSTAGFSPDLSLAVQYSAPSSTSMQLRVVDVGTGVVERDLGRLSNEYSSYVSTRFVDARTVFVGDAVPLGSPPDGIADDGAFVVDVLTGAVTRLDPGVARSSTYAATADGRRSLFYSLSPLTTWFRVDGVNEPLIGTNSGTADADLSVVVTIDGGVARLHCF